MIGQAIQFVIDEYKRTGRPAVINMSLGSEGDDYIDEMTEQAIKAGVYVVAAAGNENESACKSSPARGPRVITVGAIGPSDQRATFSNYGRCVDVFAPGVSIKSTWKEGGYRTADGTSMASPHVAGVLAIMLSENSRYRTVDKGVEFFKTLFSRNRLSELSHSPNKMLFTGLVHSPEKLVPEDPPRICSVIECYLNESDCDDCAYMDAHVNALSQSKYLYGSAKGIKAEQGPGRKKEERNVSTKDDISDMEMD